VPTLSIPLSAIERLPAIHAAAADTCRSSPILSCVCLRPCTIGTGEPCLAIAATDGKILVEERWILDAGSLADNEAKLGPDAVATLAGWCKLVRKSLSKRQTDVTVEMLVEHGQVTVGWPGGTIGDVVLRQTEGTFPRFENALIISPAEHGPAHLGWDMTYMANISKLWSCKGSQGVACYFRRGVIMKPLGILPAGCVSQVALVMPITLPT
jgi:hypothetical protein